MRENSERLQLARQLRHLKALLRRSGMSIPERNQALRAVLAKKRPVSILHFHDRAAGM